MVCLKQMRMFFVTGMTLAGAFLSAMAAERVVNVASGTTTLSDLLADDGEALTVRKTGAGTLVLDNAANTFSGGLVIDEGTVKIVAAGAQGSGKITVNCTETKNAQIRFATRPATSTAKITYANDIEVTGTSLPSSGYHEIGAVCFAQTNQVLTGSITAASHLSIVDSSEAAPGTGGTAVGNMQNYDGGTVNGAITVNGDLYFTSGCKSYFNGKVTAETFYVLERGGARGSLYLGANNAIGRLYLRSNNTPKIYVKAAGALAGTAIEWANANTGTQAGIRGTLEPTVNCSVASLEGVDHLRPDDDITKAGYTVGCNASSATCTLTLTGRADVDEVKYCGGFGNANQTLELNAREGFTQVFSNVLWKSTKELKVSGGTLVIAGTSSFETLTALTVTGTAVLDIRGCTAQSFKKLKTFHVASTARVLLAEGVSIYAQGFFLDGLQRWPERLTTESPWLSGAGSIDITGGPTADAPVALWVGGGADDQSTTAANWEDGTVPDFASFSVKPTFQGGTRAVFPAGRSCFYGLAFTALNDFTVTAADGGFVALAGSGINVCGGSADEGENKPAATYTVEVPISLFANQSIWVPTNKTLSIKGGIASNGGYSFEIVQKGTGTLELVNARYDGALKHTDGGWLHLKGDIGVPGDTGTLTIRDAVNLGTYVLNGKTYYIAPETGNVRLHGATIHKPVQFMGAGQVPGRTNADTWFGTEEGTTNVFKEAVTHTGSMRLRIASNSQVVFEKGYGDESTSRGGSANFDVFDGCVNGEYVFKGPLRLIVPGKGNCSRIGPAGTRFVFESTGNICTNYFDFSWRTVVFKVDDAFTQTRCFQATAGDANTTVMDLTTTHQKFDNLCVNGNKGLIKGEYPATIEITAGLGARADAATTNFYPSAIRGWVGLALSGPGHFVVGDPNGTHYGITYASYGDIEVSNGTMEFCQNATWLNGTNVTVRGSGTLKVNGAPFGAHCAMHFAGDGKIDIPAGVSQVCDSLDWNGSFLPVGIYTKSNCPFVTGDGNLRVRGSLVIVFR